MLQENPDVAKKLSQSIHSKLGRDLTDTGGETSYQEFSEGFLMVSTNGTVGALLCKYRDVTSSSPFTCKTSAGEPEP